MRNGKTLLRCMRIMVVLAVVTTATLCMSFLANAAPELEPTDSGAPSAMVMFPVTDKANPSEAGMRPAVFNHLIHERKIPDCESCHHTGDTVSCSSCHTVEGKADGNYITLERAMHAENIAKRAEGTTTPVSCVSCHVENLNQRDCAGCHSIIPSLPRTQKYCASCHDVSDYMTKEQLIQGSKLELDPSENEALAAETVWDRKSKVSDAKPIDPKSIPYKVTIDGLSDEFEGNVFNHRRHYESLVKRVADSQLASAFHTNPASLCSACHHESPPSQTPPKCVNCHSPTMSMETPDRPSLKAAYHLQCMGCHDAMSVSRPLNTSCTSCHKERAK